MIVTNISSVTNGAMVINAQGTVTSARIGNGHATTFVTGPCLYDESATANTVFHDHKMPLLKAFQKIQNLETKRSEAGAAFKELHKQIMLVKIWLRGIHHKCSEQFLQGYLDEYIF